MKPKDKNQLKLDLGEFFSKILGTDVEFVKIHELENDERYFCQIIENMEESIIAENAVYTFGGINLTKITNPLWVLLEQYTSLFFGDLGAEIIFWYCYSRFDKDDNLLPYVDDDGKEHKLSTPLELYAYLKTLSKEKEDMDEGKGD